MWAAFYKHKINLLLNKSLKLRTRLLGFQAFVVTTALYGSETWNTVKDHTDSLEGVQYIMLKRILGYHWTQRKSFATVIRDCRKTGVDILPMSIMISRNRLSWFGHVLRMNEDRLPKRILLSRLCLDNGKKVTLGNEKSYSRCVIDDSVIFNVVRQQMPDEKLADFITRRWETLLTLAKDRDMWRKKVKCDGIEYAMNHWYINECAASNKRHRADGVYTPKVPYEYKRTCSIYRQKETIAEPILLDITEAVRIGAVTIGRGRHEKRAIRPTQIYSL
jgi:hypothetical protein